MFPSNVLQEKYTQYIHNLCQEMVSLNVQLTGTKNYLITQKGYQATIFNFKMVFDFFSRYCAITLRFSEPLLYDCMIKVIVTTHKVAE